MKFLVILTLITSTLFSNGFYYEFDKKVQMQKQSTSRALLDSSGIQTYTTEKGQILKFKNEIIVQCQKNQYCEDDFNDLNLINFKKLSTNFYLLYLDKDQDIFEFSQKLYNKINIKSAHPNYIQTRKAR